ncbi:hypothetical protein CASFOL_030300 [Castilleja foliolosa]|uniref:PWI domain-containing protein n=1 Tax=Castilleja foliolosa TaxID=1961234 RepID=A0ABD3C8U6_9LAMI
MSGGFFRGTSADQDTRFSNKQAKLLKSQKFAPELENLVDMTKVTMDVMRPWIAKRVTELIGFEDEVLINFIYGLLEGKAVNGKQIQISLTGFMERNTGKFMKELWVLLLSAQQNVSGVPQQFLDAKEEETKKKKAETDRIVNEIQRKKEKEKQEIEERKKMGGDGARARDKHAELELTVKDDAVGSSIKQVDEKEQYKRNGRRRHGRDSQSPDSSHHSPSVRRKRSTSRSKSPNSRGYSGERRRLESISGEPPSRSRSISSERQVRSSPKRSVTPQRRHISRRSPPPWRRSSRRLSPSHSRRRSPSPERNRVRSPRRHRSRSPLHHRSRTPVRRRSRTPIRISSVRYRSRSPLRRRSPFPVRRRSPSPKRRRSPSPMQGKSLSPVRGRSPFSGHRRSPSPHQQSPFPARRRYRSPSPRQQSPSPVRRRYQRSPPTPSRQSVSPVRRRSSMHGRKRYSPQESSSPSDTLRNSLSPVRRGSAKRVISSLQSRSERSRRHDLSPARHASPKGRIEPPAENSERKPVVSLRSPQREMLGRDDLTVKERELSPSLADASRARSCIDKRRSSTHTRERMSHPEDSNPLRKAAADKPLRESSGTSVDDEKNLSSREIGDYNNRSPAHKDSLNSSQKTQLPSSDLIPDRMRHKEHRERQELSTTPRATGLSVKGMESHDDAARVTDKKIVQAYDTKGGNLSPEMEGLHKLSRKSEKNGTFDSPTKGSDDYKGKVKEKRKHKKSHRQEVESDDYSSNDSYEGRKEAKRRKKEEKKLKKEERRQRREDRRRKKDGSRSEKLRLKSGDARSLSPDHSEDEDVRRKDPRVSFTQETESEQKRLEIELREKALESLRAKRGIDN